jgi:hypothetical protein
VNRALANDRTEHVGPGLPNLASTSHGLTPGLAIHPDLPSLCPSFSHFFADIWGPINYVQLGRSLCSLGTLLCAVRKFPQCQPFSAFMTCSSIFSAHNPLTKLHCILPTRVLVYIAVGYEDLGTTPVKSTTHRSRYCCGGPPDRHVSRFGALLTFTCGRVQRCRSMRLPAGMLILAPTIRNAFIYN